MNVSRNRRCIALALGLGALLIGPALSWGWFGPAPTYYRVTASLSHGDEPIEFDVVVECRHGTTGGFGSPVRGTSTRSPWIYGQRTRAGHAVFLHMPNGCLLTDRVDEQFRPRVPPDLPAADLVVGEGRRFQPSDRLCRRDRVPASALAAHFPRRRR